MRGIAQRDDGNHGSRGWLGKLFGRGSSALSRPLPAGEVLPLPAPTRLTLSALGRLD